MSCCTYVSLSVRYILKSGIVENSPLKFFTRYWQIAVCIYNSIIILSAIPFHSSPQKFVDLCLMGQTDSSWKRKCKWFSNIWKMICLTHTFTYSKDTVSHLYKISNILWSFLLKESLHIDAERMSQKKKNGSEVWADWGNGSSIFPLPLAAELSERSTNHSQSIPQTSVGCCQTLATHSLPLSLTVFQELTCVTGVAKHKWWIAWRLPPTQSLQSKNRTKSRAKISAHFLITPLNLLQGCGELALFLAASC